ncbi:hypothetical protein M0802_005268 [Mischocyttarus mexicanus]|nr:hypothetical protein M0802_005268 [Mischocyttarus mexicanus]
MGDTILANTVTVHQLKLSFVMLYLHAFVLIVSLKLKFPRGTHVFRWLESNRNKRNKKEKKKKTKKKAAAAAKQASKQQQQHEVTRSNTTPSCRNSGICSDTSALGQMDSGRSR